MASATQMERKAEDVIIKDCIKYKWKILEKAKKAKDAFPRFANIEFSETQPPKFGLINSNLSPS